MTAAATAPSPIRITIKVPTNSARHCPARVGVYGLTSLPASLAAGSIVSKSTAVLDTIHLWFPNRCYGCDGPETLQLTHRYRCASCSARQYARRANPGHDEFSSGVE